MLFVQTHYIERVALTVILEEKRPEGTINSPPSIPLHNPTLSVSLLVIF